MDRNKRKRRKLKAYTSIFLSIILVSIIITFLAVLELLGGFAAANMAKDITAVAGRSLLSEFQPQIFKRYGLFILKCNEVYAERKLTEYIEGSCLGSKGLVKISLKALKIDMSHFSAREHAEIKRQIKKLSLGLNEYILSHFSSYCDPISDTYRSYEVEKIICGNEGDNENITELKAKLLMLRMAVNGAKRELSLREIIENAVSTITVTASLETAADGAIVLQKSNQDVAVLLDGGRVPVIDADGISGFGSYKDYLRIFLLLMPEDLKIKRMLKIMEDNLNYVDAVIFDFSDYVYGFYLNAVYSKKTTGSFLGLSTRYKYVINEFRYK